ncbi:MAG: tyrosine-type recombinase/integrase [Nitratireductor sp.]
MKPLSKFAVEILSELRELNGSNRLLFPSTQSAMKCMSENTLNNAIRRMGYGQDQMTSHGFRASASTLLNETGKWQEDAVEAELAHVGSDQIRKAYHRAVYWDERKQMC